MPNSEIRKFLAPEFLYGNDVRLFAARYVKHFGLQRILVVTDSTIRQQSWFEDIVVKLEEADIFYTIFDSVSPNPTEHEVMSGIEIYQQNKCEGLLAIGGGSPIDCAKGIGIIASNGYHILNFEGVDKVRIVCPPLICIPSTAGTSSDVSQFSIIRDMKRLVKIAIISKALVPDVALIDPVATVSMDKFLTACTGLDALTHAIEAFVSNGNSPITDNHALHAISLIKNNLYTAVQEPDNVEARYNMCIASLEAGLAFSNASLGAVHAMAHSLGGLYDLPHGLCNALLLEHVIAYNYSSEVERYNKVGELLGLQLAQMAASDKRTAITSEINRFRTSLGVEGSFRTLGVTGSDVATLSRTSVNDPCLVTNPRVAQQRDIEVIFEEAL